MLRTRLLVFVIAAPLLSQDLLVDFMDREISGRLIEITSTHIYYQIQSETDTVQYDLWEVKRVTLADGRLAFEDGRTYVAKPVSTEEPQPMEVGPEVGLPTPQPAFVPETGLPLDKTADHPQPTSIPAEPDAGATTKLRQVAEEERVPPPPRQPEVTPKRGGRIWLWAAVGAGVAAAVLLSKEPTPPPTEQIPMPPGRPTP